MRNISERQLAVVIPLLSREINSIKKTLQASDLQDDNIGEKEREELCKLQETLEQYEDFLESFKEEYEAGLKEGILLPPYEKLIQEV